LRWKRKLYKSRHNKKKWCQSEPPVSDLDIVHQLDSFENKMTNKMVKDRKIARGNWNKLLQKIRADVERDNQSDTLRRV